MLFICIAQNVPGIARQRASRSRSEGDSRGQNLLLGGRTPFADHRRVVEIVKPEGGASIADRGPWSMTFHSLFKLHSADLRASRWEYGRFVTDCLICSREMVKPASEIWRLSTPLELAERGLERTGR